MSVDISNLTSIIKSQLPDFVKSDYPKLISFLESYYAFLEQENNNLWQSKHLIKNIDIDQTLNSFVQHFKSELADVFPSYTKIPTAKEVDANFFGLANDTNSSATAAQDHRIESQVITDNGSYTETIYSLNYNPLSEEVESIKVTKNTDTTNADSVDVVMTEGVDYTLDLEDAEGSLKKDPKINFGAVIQENVAYNVYYYIFDPTVEDQTTAESPTNEERSIVPKKHYEDKKLLLKKIKDFYRAKGSEKSYEFFFRVLFNTDAKLAYPKEFLFKPSFGVWSVDTTIRTKTDLLHSNLTPVRIIGNDSGSTAIIEYYERLTMGNDPLTEYYVSNVKGEFDDRSFTIQTEEGLDIYELSGNAITGFVINNSGSKYIERFPFDIPGTGRQADGYIKRVSSGKLEEVYVYGSGLDEEVSLGVDHVISATSGLCFDYLGTTISTQFDYTTSTECLQLNNSWNSELSVCYDYQGDPNNTLTDETSCLAENNTWLLNSDNMSLGDSIPLYDAHVSDNDFVIPETDGVDCIKISIPTSEVRSNRPFSVELELYDAEGDIYAAIDYSARKRAYEYVKSNVDDLTFDINGDGVVTWHDVELIRRYVNGLRDAELYLDGASHPYYSPDTENPVSLFPEGSKDNAYSETVLKNLWYKQAFDVNFDDTTYSDIDVELIAYYVEQEYYTSLATPIDASTDFDDPNIVLTKTINGVEVDMFPYNPAVHRLGLPTDNYNDRKSTYTFAFEPYGSYEHTITIWASPHVQTAGGVELIEHAPRTILDESGNPLLLFDDLTDDTNDIAILTEPYSDPDNALLRRVVMKRKSWGICGTGYITGERILFNNDLTYGSGAVARIEEVDNLGGIVKIALINGGYGYKRAPHPYVELENEAGNVSKGRGCALVSDGTFGQILQIGMKNFGGYYDSISTDKCLDSSGSYKPLTNEADCEASGYTWTTNDSIYLTGMGKGNGVITPIVGAFCTYDGVYNTKGGFLSDKNVLQDSYFYQDYSYVIRVNKQIDEWRDLVKKIVHPAGLEFFGEFVTEAFAEKKGSSLALVRMTIEIIKNLNLTPKLMDGSGRFTGISARYNNFDIKRSWIARDWERNEKHKFEVYADSPASIVVQTQNGTDLLETADISVILDNVEIARLGGVDYPLDQKEHAVTQHTIKVDNIATGTHILEMKSLTKDKVKANHFSVFLHDIANEVGDKQNTTYVNPKRGGSNANANWHLGSLKDGAPPQTEKHIIYIFKRHHQLASLGTVGRSLDRNKFRWSNQYPFEEVRDRYSPPKFDPDDKLHAEYGDTKMQNHNWQEMTVEELEKMYQRNDEPMLDAYVNIYPKRLWVTDETKRPLGHDTLGPRRLSMERYKLNKTHVIDIDAYYIEDISVNEEEDTYRRKMNDTMKSSINLYPKIISVETNYKYKKNNPISASVLVTSDPGIISDLLNSETNSTWTGY